MRKEYSYKLQGNGKHSWRCDEFDGETMISSFMIYEGEDEYLKNEATLIALIPNV